VDIFWPVTFVSFQWKHFPFLMEITFSLFISFMSIMFNKKWRLVFGTKRCWSLFVVSAKCATSSEWWRLLEDAKACWRVSEWNWCQTATLPCSEVLVSSYYFWTWLLVMEVVWLIVQKE
jgi:hypothetical protein